MIIHTHVQQPRVQSKFNQSKPTELEVCTETHSRNPDHIHLSGISPKSASCVTSYNSIYSRGVKHVMGSQTCPCDFGLPCLVACDNQSSTADDAILGLLQGKTSRTKTEFTECFNSRTVDRLKIFYFLKKFRVQSEKAQTGSGVSWVHNSAVARHIIRRLSPPDVYYVLK